MEDNSEDITVLVVPCGSVAEGLKVVFIGAESKVDTDGNLDDSIVCEVKVFNVVEAELDKLNEYGNFDDTNIFIVVRKFEAEGLNVILVEAEVDEVNEDGNFGNLDENVVSAILAELKVKCLSEVSVEAEVNRKVNLVDSDV